MVQVLGCTKNPGHTSYVSPDTLTEQHIPEPHRDENTFQLIRTVAELTVKISVTLTSPDRPEFWPDSPISYPYYNSRSSSNLRLGSGLVYFVTLNRDEHNKCPCHKCLTSKEPSKIWGTVEVMTATHIVFDAKEAQHTSCRFFYDANDSDDITLNTFTLKGADIEKNWCHLNCITCNSDVLSKLNTQMDSFNKLRSNDINAPVVDKFVFISSHPHGGPKQISFGKLVNSKAISKNWTQLSYTACTCPGSGGAYVHVLGDGRSVFHYPHVHTGVSDAGVNFSSIGYCASEPISYITTQFYLPTEHKGSAPTTSDIIIDKTLAYKMPTKWEKGAMIREGYHSKIFAVVNQEGSSDLVLIIKERKLPKHDKGDQILEAYEKEYSIFQKFDDHIRIIPYYGYICEASKISKFLAYMPLGSLQDFYLKNGPITEDRSLHYTKQILQGLQYLHDHQIIHLNIRGKNILMESEEHIRISHFEYSEIGAQPSSDAKVEPLRWHAPELVNPDLGSGLYNTQADIWSLGCTLVEMLTGDVPYESIKSLAAVVIHIGNGKPPLVRKAISEEMEYILSKFFCPQPDHRMTANALLNDTFYDISEGSQSSTIKINEAGATGHSSLR